MADEPLLKICGRYAVCDVIGSGGMATVHIGRLLGPVGFSRTVAIKRMHPHLSSDPQFVAMFLDEARVAARVQHANVVSTLDVVTEASELFLVMEYVEGESFARVLRTVGKKGVRLPHPILGAIVSQALHGLHAVHEARDEAGRTLGLIHRDVSPDNIIVGSDGLARVLDFGIAKATEHGRRTQAGKIKGKVAYMAPEQMRGKDLDRRADLYAASALLWEALTGARMVKGQSDIEMIHHALSGPPPPPSSVVPSLPPAIDALVMKGLAHAPEDRFATAREMGMAVEKAFGLASPATVAQLIEGMLGASLAKRAALVAEAMRRTGGLDERNITQGSSSTPEPRVLALDSQNLFSDVSESPRGLVGPASPQPSAVAPVAASAKAAGPFAPVQPRAPDVRPEPAPPLITRGYGSDGDMPFAELLASGGTDPANQPRAIAVPAPPAARPNHAGTELMGGSHAAAPAGPTLQSPSHPAPAVAAADVRGPATILMPDLLAPGPLHTQQSPGLGAGSSGSAAGATAATQPAPAQSRSELPSLDLAIQQPPSAAPRSAPVASKPSSPGGGAGGMDVDWGGTRGPAAATIREPAANPTSLQQGQLYAAHAAPSSRLPVAVAIALATICLAAVALYLMFADKRSTTAASAARPPESQTAMSACELLRRRIYSGGAATGLSREGWQAELWLRGQGGAAIDPAKVDLAALQGSDPASGSESSKLTVPGQKGDEGLVIRLWGPTAQAAFDPQGTDALIKQADLAFEQTNAEAGALYLKCSHLPHHDIGVWFRGNDLTSTSAAVLFAMGLYAEKAVIKEGALGPPDKSTFERVLKKVKEGRMDELDLDVQRYGGSLQPLPNKRGTRIVFPTERMPDAVRLSRVIADRAGIEDL